MIRNLLNRQRTTLLVVALRHCEEERRSNPDEERTAAAYGSCPGAAASCRRWKRNNKLLIVPFPLMGKEPKDQGRLHRTSPRLSKRLTLRSRSTFSEGKRQAPLREGQAFSHPLRALPRPAAGPPRPPRLGFGVPVHGALQAGMSYRPRNEGAKSQISFAECRAFRRSQSMTAAWPCLVYALFMPCLCLVCE